jgi:serine-type D-Ala-D-Ala carboxypeptidase (penicillin-binding protein 5/6)
MLFKFYNAHSLIKKHYSHKLCIVLFVAVFSYASFGQFIFNADAFAVQDSSSLMAHPPRQPRKESTAAFSTKTTLQVTQKGEQTNSKWAYVSKKEGIEQKRSKSNKTFATKTAIPNKATKSPSSNTKSAKSSSSKRGGIERIAKVVQGNDDTTQIDDVKMLFGVEPVIDAKYAILVDYDSGVVLYEKNADVTIHPSSMTKIMTAYLAFDKLHRGIVNLDDKFVVSKKAWRTNGSKMFVGLNEAVCVEDLLRGIMVQSGNDACVVLSEGLAGSEEVFAQEMNQMAKKLGMTETNFLNANGLAQDGHFSTVRDLAILGRSLLHDFPKYAHYHKEKEFSYNNIKQTNRNLLLGQHGVDGIKTGYTEEGGYGIVLSAQSKDGMRLVAVVNGLSNNQERNKAALNLITHGFRYYKSVSLFKANDVVVNTNIIYGDTFLLPLVTKEDVKIVVSRDIHNAQTVHYTGTMRNMHSSKVKIRDIKKSESAHEICDLSMGGNKLQVRVKYADRVVAPIIAGQVMGSVLTKIEAQDGTSEVYETPLYAGQSVGEANFLQNIVHNLERFVIGTQ